MPNVRIGARAVVVLLLLAGCGGGGGSEGTPPSVALWNGQHHMTGVLGPAGLVVLGYVTTEWGVAAFDGAGGFAETHDWNLDGTVSGFPTASFLDTTYAVDADRAVRLSVPMGEFARGGIAADGALALVSSTGDGIGPGIRMFGRREGVHDPFPLSGTWRMAAFSHDKDVLGRRAIFGTMTFDAAGGGTMTVTVNADGVIGNPTPAALEYGVSADGGIFVDLGFDTVFEGGLVRGGDVILLAGSTVADADPSIVVLVREVAAPTVAALAGSWFLEAFAYDPGSSDYFGLEGRATTDAAGNLTASLLRNSEGTISTLPPVGGSWTVDGAGLVTLTLSGGTSVVGRAGPGHDLVILAGGTTPGSPPGLFLLLR